MLRIKSIIATLVCVGGLFLSLSATSGMAYAGENEAATFTGSGWTSHIRFDSVRVTVSGPDGYYWQETSDHSGNLSLPNDALADGAYTWELRFVPAGAPRPDTVETDYADENGRTVGRLDDGGEAVRPVVTSGTFRVRNGSVVMSDAEENGQ